MGNGWQAYQERPPVTGTLFSVRGQEYQYACAKQEGRAP